LLSILIGEQNTRIMLVLLKKNIAHEFVDAGADLVIGSHPHVIQGVEIYKDKAIFYSLGNFIFDQIQNGTKEGLTVGVKFGEDSTEFSLWPTVIDKIPGFVG